MAKINKEDIEHQEDVQRIMQQLQQLQQHVENLDKNLLEIDSLKLSLKELENLKKGDRILAPVTNGIFIEADIVNSKHLLVNVGEGAVLKKTILETIQLLEKQKVEINSSKEEVQSKIEELYTFFQG